MKEATSLREKEAAAVAKQSGDSQTNIAAASRRKQRVLGKQGYAPASGQITETLSKTKETMGKDLGDLTANEEAAKKTFEDLVDAKNKKDLDDLTAEEEAAEKIVHSYSAGQDSMWSAAAVRETEQFVISYVLAMAWERQGLAYVGLTKEQLVSELQALQPEQIAGELQATLPATEKLTTEQIAGELQVGDDLTKELSTMEPIAGELQVVGDLTKEQFASELQALLRRAKKLTTEQIAGELQAMQPATEKLSSEQIAGELQARQFGKQLRAHRGVVPQLRFRGSSSSGR